MKKLSIILLLFNSTIALNAQTTSYEEIVKTTVESINLKSFNLLNPILAKDFNISGTEGIIAQKVAQQIVEGLNDSILSYELINRKQQNDTLFLQYLFHYKKLGVKEAKFELNKQLQIINFLPFEMKVKTLDSNAKINQKKTNLSHIKIPFELRDNQIFVKVKLDGELKDFIFDSGAPFTIINAEYFSNEQKENCTITSTKGVNGSLSGSDIVTINSLSFAGITLEKTKILSTDLSNIESDSLHPVSGLIGYNTFKDYNVLYDYPSNLLELIDSSSLNFTNQTIIDCIPFYLSGHIPVIDIQIEDKTLKMGIDCGAGSNLLAEKYFNDLNKEIKNIHSTILKGADKISKQTIQCQMKKMVIGKTYYKNSETVFSNIDHLNKGKTIKLDGLLGYEFLSKQKTLISYCRKMIYFIK